MIITNEKIEVTDKMMQDAGMTRYGKYGIPVNPKDTSEGLLWKNILDLEDEDFNVIEEYFLLKNK